MVYNLVDEVDDRVSGHGPWSAMHGALTVREDAFFPSYGCMWEGTPEETDVKERLHLRGVHVVRADVSYVTRLLASAPVARPSGSGPSITEKS